MTDDGYTAWHQAKLWSLLPAIYRTLDEPDGAGPLREMVNRIGGEFATLRRGIDRLLANQSIETCDDWAIPYIGDLLATRLVSCLDARAQRVDVAKTIYYRRRAGTLGLLEELAADIAGRDARAVEFFRRLGRTRHQYDPPIGVVPTPAPGAPASSAVIEGLAGAVSGTPAGGFADLRKRYAAHASESAFDEYAHTADLRRGGQSQGWRNISHLGVFVWWLYAFPVEGGTPVSGGGSSPCFTFDPTGRRVPLFARSRRASLAAGKTFGENWIAADAFDLPGPVSNVLWSAYPDALYPASFAVDLGGGGPPAPLPAAQVAIDPEQGVYSYVGGPPEGAAPLVSYHFGFSSPIGAGGFDDRALETLDPVPLIATVSGGGGLDAALAALSGTGAVEVANSLTYPGPSADLDLPAPPPAPAAAVVQLRAADERRPVLRWTSAGARWTIRGAGGSLVLQGLWLAGADLVLTGAFDTVRLRLCTLDPGTQGDPGLFGVAIDGVSLAPTTLWIEGEVGELILERCVTGPIRTRLGGAVETLSASDSIVQSIPTHPVASNAPILDPTALAEAWKAGGDATSQAIVAALPAAAKAALDAYTPGAPPDAALVTAMAAALAGQDRAAMEAAYPLALADLAIGGSSGEVALSRCTVLGRIAAHRLSASECILDDVATVEDPQHGCVRFCAYAAGSVLHQPYRSVRTLPRGPVFRSRRFGEPDYARLYRLADRAILDPAPGDTILGGAQNESEMGAFCGEGAPLKRRGLSIKFEEYAPLGLYPVWIEAD